jgi:WD40 repeat protein
MLRSEVDLPSLLEVYRQVFSKKNVKDDEANPLISVLRLSGIASSRKGALFARNRIYSRVFDAEWIRNNMPDAERRRQRSAYRRGMIRAATVGAIIVAIIASLAVIAVVEKRRAVLAQWTAREALYTANLNLAREAADSDNLGRTMELLDEARPLPGEPDLRGWEWRYLWRLCHLDLQTLRGHTDWVNSVVFSPDGKVLATASRDRTVRFWDATTGAVIRILRGHTDGVSSVVFSPDGKTVLTASMDKTAKLWNADTGREILTLRGHTEGIISASFSPMGDRIATASKDGTVRVWDTVAGQLIQDFRYVGRPNSKTRTKADSRINEVQAAIFGPDGNTVFAVDYGSSRTFDVATGREMLTFHGGRKYTCAAMSPSGRTMAAGSGHISIWDSSAGVERLYLKGHTGIVRSLAFSPNSSTLASASDDSTVRLWEMSSGREVLTLRGHTDSVRAVAFSPDGRIVATGSADGTAKLWLPENYREHVTLGISDPRAIAISSNRRLATAGVDGAVRLWEPATGEQTHILLGQKGYLNSVCFSPDGSSVTSAGGGHDPTARIYDAATGRRMHVLAGHSAEIRTVAYSPDNKVLATASGDATVRLWDVTTGRTLRILKGHVGSVWGVAFSPDGGILASGGDDRIVRIWNVASGRVIQTLPPSTSRVTSLAFAASGRTMAAGSDDNAVQIWDMSEREGERRLIRTIREHRGYLEMAFAPDGNRLATLGSGDGNLRLTNTANGREAFVLKPGRGVVGHLAFSPDSTLLAYRNGPLTVRLCYAPPLAEIVAYERAPNARRMTAFEFRPMTGERSLIANSGSLIRSAPADAYLYSARAQTHAEAGRWKQAAADFSRAFKLGGTDADSVAVTKLAAGDGTDLPKIAEHLRSSALTNRDPLGAARDARYALLIPSGLSNPANLVPVIKRIPTGTGTVAWRAGLSGLANYRAGRFREAIGQLEVSLTLDPSDYDSYADSWQVPFCWLLLGMAHQRIGQSTEARFLNARAVHWIDKAQSTNNGHEGPNSVHWRGRAQLAALRREADALIGDTR